MPSKRFFLFGVVLTIIIIGLIPSTSTSGTQWFPEHGTSVEYSVTHYLTFESGLKTECSEYILYNFSNNFYAVPTILRTYFSAYPWPGTIISNETQLGIQHSYSNHSATQLDKLSTIIWDEGSFSIPLKTLYLVLFENASPEYYYEVDMYNFTVPRDGIPDYFTYTTPYYIHDYINCSAGILEPTQYIITNVLISPTNIVARWVLPLGIPGSANLTYVADGNGKVLNIGYTLITPTIETFNLRCAAYGFSIIEPPDSPPDGIPGFSLSWTILTLFGSMFGVTYLMKGTRKKVDL